MKKCVKQWFFYKILFWGFCKQTKESRNPLCPFSARHSIPIYSRAYFSSSEERISMNFNLQFISIYKFQIQFTVVPTSLGGKNLQFTIYISLYQFVGLQKAAEDPRWNKRLVQWWNYKLMTNSKSHLFLSHWGAQFHQLLWLLFSILQQRSVFNTNN